MFFFSVPTNTSVRWSNSFSFSLCCAFFFSVLLKLLTVPQLARKTNRCTVRGNYKLLYERLHRRRNTKIWFEFDWRQFLWCVKNIVWDIYDENRDVPQRLRRATQLVLFCFQFTWIASSRAPNPFPCISKFRRLAAYQLIGNVTRAIRGCSGNPQVQR